MQTSLVFAANGNTDDCCQELAWIAKASPQKASEMKAKKKHKTVYDAAIERLDIIFKEFDNVFVSFSGGKDSGVLLHLCIDYARRNYPGRKIGVLHIDYEAQYQMTTDYVDAELSSNRDVIEPYRICLPIAAQCATSMHQAHWIPWDADNRDIWVRDMPAESINAANCPFDFFKKGMTDYELQKRFARWFHKKQKAKRTACLVGIRTQESFRRWKALHGERKEGSNFEGLNYSTQMYPSVFNFYPLFDWTTEDIWTANARFGWPYNKLYDLFYQAGLTLNQMRVASPFNDCAIESLKLYRVIDPTNWGRMVGRVNGVNFAGMYGGTTAMGWKSITLPQGHTWKTYMEFLLSTLPSEVAANYRKKVETSIEFWRKTGGEVSDETIELLKKQGVALEVGPRGKKSKRCKIRMDYIDDVDLVEFQLIPTFKRVCICILKNDHACKYMGFGMTKEDWALRKDAEAKFAKGAT
jgi:predicted phosphoadenosine phosphosulfate sulfurtransferase